MSTPDEMLREAERAHAALPCAETLATLVGVRHRVGWKSPEQLKREQLDTLMAQHKHPTKEICVLLGEVGGELWSGDEVTGTVQRWKVNGKCKTWVTEPDHFQLPLKSGWSDYSYVAHYRDTAFVCAQPLYPCDVTIRRVELAGDYAKDNVLGIGAGTYFGKGEKIWAVEVIWPSNMAENGVVKPYPWGAPLKVNDSGRQELYALRSHDRDSIRSEVRNTLRDKGFATLFRR